MDGMGWDIRWDGMDGDESFPSLRSLKKDYQSRMESRYRYYKYYWASSHLTGRGRAPPPVSELERASDNLLTVGYR